MKDLVREETVLGVGEGVYGTLCTACSILCKSGTALKVKPVNILKVSLFEEIENVEHNKLDMYNK